MPRIDQDIKLDFKDVLFRPKRSTIRSRSDVRFILVPDMGFAFLGGAIISDTGIPSLYARNCLVLDDTINFVISELSEIVIEMLFVDKILCTVSRFRPP